jgi:hypothetical protein
MPGIYTKKFSWLPSPSPWQQAQAWRAKRRAMIEDFQNQTANLTAGFSAAMSNQITGTGQVVTQTAIARLQAAAKAKAAALVNRTA